MAAYLGLPIVVMRLLFLFAALWLGGGVLVYLILWLLLPVQDENKAFLDDFKLERDQQNAILGGVCAGLAENIGMNTAVLRILWVIATLYFGFGIIPYVILWILMPKKSV